MVPKKRAPGKGRARKPARKAVSFRYVAESAERVSLVGSFNGWRESATPMNKGESGAFSVTIDLEPGDHQFKFLVDGEWRLEPFTAPPREQVASVPDGFGSLNHVVHVP